MEKKLREHHVGSLVLRGLMYLAAGITVVALLYVLFYILVNGVPALFTSKGIFSTKYKKVFRKKIQIFDYMYYKNL